MSETCKECLKTLQNTRTLRKHWKICKMNPNKTQERCPGCGEWFSRKDSLSRHQKGSCKRKRQRGESGIKATNSAAIAQERTKPPEPAFPAREQFKHSQSPTEASFGSTCATQSETWFRPFLEDISEPTPFLPTPSQEWNTGNFLHPGLQSPSDHPIFADSVVQQGNVPSKINGSGATSSSYPLQSLQFQGQPQVYIGYPQTAAPSLQDTHGRSSTYPPSNSVGFWGRSEDPHGVHDGAVLPMPFDFPQYLGNFSNTPMPAQRRDNSHLLRPQVSSEDQGLAASMDQITETFDGFAYHDLATLTASNGNDVR